MGLRVAVVGATGNVGTSLLPQLAGDERVDSILGIARRLPELRVPKTEWVAADIERADLATLFDGAAVVVNLAWRIQPSRREHEMWATNVDGSMRVFRAAAKASVPALVHASSVGVYSGAPKDRFVDERWPREGIQSSFYSRHKAEVERRLDAFEREQRSMRLVRMRPSLIFKREMGAQVRRLFTGPLLPRSLVRPGAIPLFPDIPRLRFQAAHSYDIGRAYHLAVTSEVSGAFNVAAEPVLDGPALRRILRARRLPLAAGVARTATALTWRMRVHPTPPGWLDLALGAPLLDWTRAREELGWEPTRRADDALLELMEGVREGAGLPTPPLAPETSGRARVREFATGVGGREGVDAP